MLRKNVVGSFAWMVLAGAAGAACSSSSGGAATDAGNDTGKMPPADAGMDAKPHDSGADTSGKKPDASGDAAPTGPTARFTLGTGSMPNYLDVPFPSDIYLTGGKIVDPVPGMAAVVTGSPQFITHELGKLNGFSRIALTSLYVDDPSATDGVATLDPASLPADEAACVADTSAVFLLDLSATGAAARIPCRAQFHDDRAFSMGWLPPVARRRPRPRCSPARRAQVRDRRHEPREDDGGHEHRSVERFPRGHQREVEEHRVHDGLHDRGGQPHRGARHRPRDDRRHRPKHDDHRDDRPLQDQHEARQRARARARVGPDVALAPMGDKKFAALVGGKLPMGFTDTLDDYLGTVVAAPLADGNDDPNGDLPVRAHNQLAAIGTAVFQAQNYLSPSGGYAALDDATFTFDSTGNVVPNATNPTAPIWVTFFIPTATMPATGYPVVIVQHGLGESRANEAFNLANTFAAQGWMVAAIDSVTFGARAPEAKYQVDLVNNFASGGGGYQGPDGIADAVGGSTNGPEHDFFRGILRDHRRHPRPVPPGRDRHVAARARARLEPRPLAPHDERHRPRHRQDAHRLLRQLAGGHRRGGGGGHRAEHPELGPQRGRRRRHDRARAARSSHRGGGPRDRGGRLRRAPGSPDRIPPADEPPSDRDRPRRPARLPPRTS